MKYVWIVTGEDWEGAVACASPQAAYRYVEDFYLDVWEVWGKDEYEDEEVLTDALAKLSSAYSLDNYHFGVLSRLGTVYVDKTPVVV